MAQTLRRQLVTIIPIAAVMALGASAADLRIGLPYHDGLKEWKAAKDAATTLAAAAGETLAVELVPRVKDGPTVEADILNGALDGGLVTSAGSDALAIGPDGQLYALPFTFTSPEQIRHVRKHMDADVLAALSTGPYDALGFVGFGSAIALASGSLAAPDDWRKRRLWIPEAWKSAQTLEAAGITTVTLPTSDVRKSMKAGTIDTVFAPPALAVMKQWHRRAEVFLEMPCAYIYTTWLVQDAAMATLTEGERDRLDDFLADLGATLETLAASREQDARDVFEGFGIRATPGNPDLVRQWAAWRDTVREQLPIEERPRQPLLDRLDTLLKTYGQSDGE